MGKDLIEKTKQTAELYFKDVKGERPFEKDVSREHYHRIERAYGRFRRSFVLGTPIHNDGITATYRDGVLEIVLPKVEEAKARKIEITE